MGIFDKKNCAICGKETGLFGTIKLEDGTICRECSGKLSPFFTGRKKTTVNEIREQLKYREKNNADLKTFNPDTTIGEDTKIHIESGSGRFVISKANDWRSRNPDLLTRKMVNSCDIEVKEHKDELFDKGENGERISFDPPQYRYTYEFITHIHVESPYFEEIKFELTDQNKRPEGKESADYMEYVRMGRRIQAALLPDKYTYSDGDDITVTFDTSDTGTAASGDEWKCECGHINHEGKFCSKCGKARPTRWFCPDCGKENHGQFCVDCGRRKPE